MRCFGVALQAYERWLAEHGDSAAETLPGVNATSRQLFFINFAQVWCSSMRPEAMRIKLKIAVHSPARFRYVSPAKFSIFVVCSPFPVRRKTPPRTRA